MTEMEAEKHEVTGPQICLGKWPSKDLNRVIQN